MVMSSPSVNVAPSEGDVMLTVGGWLLTVKLTEALSTRYPAVLVCVKRNELMPSFHHEAGVS